MAERKGIHPAMTGQRLNEAPVSDPIAISKDIITKSQRQPRRALRN